MCKVCRVWSDLSLALFSYACRPNFHHKYLTLTDPLLSVCEEALISPAYMCIKAQMPKMKLCINVHFGAETCACAHANVCARTCEATEDYPPRSNSPANFLPFQSVCAVSLVCRTTQFAANRNQLYLGVAQLEDRLCFVCPLFFPPSSVSSVFSSVLGQMRKIKPITT